MKTILITGISSGIGRATAENFLEQGHTVVGSVRDLSTVSDLKSKYGARLILWKCNFLVLEEIDSITTVLSENKISHLDVLVNNAGIVAPGPVQFQDFVETQNILKTNVLAVIRITQLMIPYLIPTQGRIINISSISGVSASPFLSSYCASKYAIEGFSESLRREMRLYGIQVSIIGPGSIKTPIWFKGFESIRSAYQSTPYAQSFRRFLDFAANEEQNALPVSAVVQNIQQASFSRCPKIRYAPIPRKFFNSFIPRLLPKVIMDKIMCKALGLNIKKN